MNTLLIFRTYRFLLLNMLILTLLGTNVCGQTRQKLEEQRTQALLEIEETSRLLNETQKNQKESFAKLNLLVAQEKQFEKLISGINAEIKYADRQINETTTKISRMNGEIEKMKEEYAKLIHHTYKNRGKYNKLIYVLSAKDFNEAHRRLKYFQQYSEYRKKQVAEIRVKQKEMQVLIAQLTTQKIEKEKLLAEQIRESKKLESVKTEINKEVSDLKVNERKLKSQLATQQDKATKLQAQIQKVITEEIRKRNATSTNISDKLTPADRLISDNFKGNRGRLPWPTERGTITGYFGINPHSLFKNIPVPNNGIDITTVSGAEVRAIFDGVVSSIYAFQGSNLTVFVRHGNYITAYSNLVDVKVKVGEKIKSKQTIGKVYTEKGSNSAILHFEIWEDTGKGEPQKLNPELWISRN